jgi:DNA-binding MarR family transcriptional regulator
MPSARKSRRLGPGEGALEIESIRTSLVHLRRLFQRKELAQLWAAAFGDTEGLDYGDLRLLDAVRASQESDAGAATVGEIARHLGIDPSRASRQVAKACAGGLLQRQASLEDGRSIVLQITPRGARLQAKGSALTRARIALALEGWSARDREQLGRLLGRFVRQLGE